MGSIYIIISNSSQKGSHSTEKVTLDIGFSLRNKPHACVLVWGLAMHQNAPSQPLPVYPTWRQSHLKNLAQITTETRNDFYDL